MRCNNREGVHLVQEKLDMDSFIRIGVAPSQEKKLFTNYEWDPIITIQKMEGKRGCKSLRFEFMWTKDLECGQIMKVG